jgi:hypothetical protein
MSWRRYLLVGPIIATLGAAFVATLLTAPADPPERSLTFSFNGQEVTADIEEALIRRRTITPEFDPPLDVRAGRVIFARGFVACDPGEVFTIEVEVTQGDATAHGRTAGRCTGEVQEWTAPAVARRGATFSPGPAHACATATTRRAGVTDTFQWCADPVLTAI